MANVSDPAITQAYEDIRNDASGVDWVVLGYANPSTIKVDAQGSGSVAEGVAHLHDDQVQYAMFKVSRDYLWRCLIERNVMFVWRGSNSFSSHQVKFTADDDTKRTKFVFVAWGGEKASILKRGKMSVHKASIKTIFKDFALEIATGNKDDLNEATFIERVKAINY